VAILVIDGYNLVGTMHGNLEAERERLLEALSAYQQVSGHEITVIFDGWREGPGEEHREKRSGLEVVFSALGETADAVIGRALPAGHQCIVVSSDREVQKRTWTQGSVPVGADTFLGILERRTRGLAEGEYAPWDPDEEEEEMGPRKKGNPRKLSKKDRAVQRALSKL
jgi:predicted RNA-binding protein with PIN domain